MKIEDLEFHVLVCLAVARDWKHGYAVRRWLCEKHGIDVAFQSIYRVIERLHKKRFVELQETGFSESIAGIPRKNYRLTTAGWRHVAERVSSARGQRDRLTWSLAEYEKVVSHEQREESRGG